LKKKYWDIVNVLIENGANINKRNSFHETPIYAAAKRGDLFAVKLLMKKGADINKLSNGKTPLFIATAKRKFEIQRKLVDSGSHLGLIQGIWANCISFAGFANILIFRLIMITVIIAILIEYLLTPSLGLHFRDWWSDHPRRFRELSTTLDLNQDWMALGKEFGYSENELNTCGNKKSPTHALFLRWIGESGSTLGKLRNSLGRIKQYNATIVIDRSYLLSILREDYKMNI